MKHTPEPWYAIKGDVLNPDRPWGIVKFLSLEECQEIDGDDATPNSRTSVIAETTSANTEEQSEADAYLLASAPTVLAALERLLEESNPFVTDTESCECGENGSGFDDDGKPCEHIQAARAIAKAKRGYQCLT